MKFRKIIFGEKNAIFSESMMGLPDTGVAWLCALRDL